MELEIKILEKDLYLYPSMEYSTIPSNTFGLPSYATQGSAAMDVRAAHDVMLLPGCTHLVGTGLAMWIKDPNVCALVIPRSGLGHKEGLVLGNLVGLIDSDYQGELKLSLWNRSEYVREYKKGDRVAQIVFLPVLKPTMTVVDEFSTNTERAIGGFGHTGV